MRRALVPASLLLTCALLLTLGTVGIGRPAADPPSRPPQLGALPLAFEPNAGQTDPSVRFLTHAPGGTIFFTPAEVVLALDAVAAPPPSIAPDPAFPARHGAAPGAASVAHLRFMAANTMPAMQSGDRLPGTVNYFLGNDPASWQTGLPTYAGITYQQLYLGVDLAYTGAGGYLKGTYTIMPGADPGQIQWRYDCGIRDAECSVAVDDAGALQIRVGEATLTEQAPRAWQKVDGRRVPVAVRYARHAAGIIGFALGAYNRAAPLVIDPTLVFSTYLGGSANDNGMRLAVDATGNIYLAGQTASLNFPTANPYQPANAGNGDVFIAKFDPSGATLLYATYLGGSGFEAGAGLALDSTGNIYVAGFTASTNFPLLNPIQPSYRGGAYDGFVTKLNAGGSALVYSTYLGGSVGDFISALAVDGSGNAYVAGETTSANFPTVNAYQPSMLGYGDAFVTKVNPAGSAWVYSTFLGGGDYEGIYGLAVDANNYVYLSGYTHSYNFPTLNAYQSGYGGGVGDSFVTKLDRNGAALVYSTYLGGSNDDVGFGIAIDAAGNAYHVGYTNSLNYPVQNPIQPANQGGYDLFVTKLTPGGNGLAYSTYLGGSNDERGGLTTPGFFGVAVNGAGETYVAANTRSTNFPTVNPLQATNAGASDAIIAKLNAAGAALIYATYLGGAGDDVAATVVLVPGNDIVIAGSTQSTNFPTRNPYQPANAGGSDAFIARITDLGLTPTATPTATATHTPTSTPTNTPSPTPTSTALIPTATRTATATFTPIPCTIQFTDVDFNNPFYPYIRCLACHQIISGYADGTFRPNNDVTRAQVSKMVANAAGFSDAIQSTQQSFADLPASAPFWVYVERLARRGYINGYQCGGPGEPCDPQQRPYFRPNNAVTRGQLAKIDAQAAGYNDPIPTQQQTFADVPYGSPFWVWVEQVALHGVISGYQCGGPGEPCDPQQRPYFRPYNTATRGQTSKIVANTFFPVGCLPSRAAPKGPAP